MENIDREHVAKYISVGFNFFSGETSLYEGNQRISLLQEEYWKKKEKKCSASNIRKIIILESWIKDLVDLSSPNNSFEQKRLKSFLSIRCIVNKELSDSTSSSASTKSCKQINKTLSNKKAKGFATRTYRCKSRRKSKGSLVQDCAVVRALLAPARTFRLDSFRGWYNTAYCIDRKTVGRITRYLGFSQLPRCIPRTLIKKKTGRLR